MLPWGRLGIATTCVHREARNSLPGKDETLCRPGEVNRKQTRPNLLQAAQSNPIQGERIL